MGFRQSFINASYPRVINSILMGVQPVETGTISGQQKTSLPSGGPSEHFGVDIMLAKRQEMEEEND